MQSATAAAQPVSTGPMFSVSPVSSNVNLSGAPQQQKKSADEAKTSSPEPENGLVNSASMMFPVEVPENQHFV